MDRESLKETLCSISAIPVTPFDENGQIDFTAYHHLIERLIDGGIEVITPNGNTGEFYALSAQECEAVVRAAVESADQNTLVVCGIGYDTATAIEMGRTAQEAGAGAVMIHQPVHPFQSQPGWVAYHRAILDALPDMGGILYVRDTLITGGMIRELADASPNLIGIKYAVANPQQFAVMVQSVPAERLTWVCGVAEGWAPFFFVAGARGFTSGLVNVAPRLSAEMLDCLKQGDYAGAMRVWELARPFEELRARRNSANNVSVVKEALAQLGLCERRVRPPISELPENEQAEVSAILSRWGQVTPLNASNARVLS